MMHVTVGIPKVIYYCRKDYLFPFSIPPICPLRELALSNAKKGIWREYN